MPFAEIPAPSEPTRRARAAAPAFRTQATPTLDSPVASASRRGFGPALLLVLALSALAACGDAREAGSRRAADTAAAEEAPRPPYRVVSVARSGAIIGKVTLASPPPADSVFQPPADVAELCGPTRRVELVDHRGELLENVVIWLADARSGKALPIERRYEITNTDCALEPRVQAAVVGGMINVRNADRSAHRTIFELGGDTLATVRESEAGQVVPTEKALARRGLVEVVSGTYPWSRAWIRVFDHPYFAVTNRDGTFTIDSVPPGSYRLVAWEARLGTREREVTVQAATDSRVDLSF